MTSGVTGNTVTSRTGTHGASAVSVVLASTYELGHQPLALAAAAAALRARGHEVDCIDLAVEPFDAARFRHAALVGISLPMHTAARLGVPLAERVRELNPTAHIACYGLYAPLLHELLTAPGGGGSGDGSAPLVDSTIGGEYEAGLCELADRLATEAGAGPPAPNGAPSAVSFARQRFALPDRRGLPPLARYAHLDAGGTLEPAGYVEASRGCAHRCRHCPVTAAYEGRLRLVQPEVVLADIDQLVAAGARHITFGDPDFLNAVPHSLAIVEGLHARHPDVSFDATIKVEHLLEHAALLPTLRDRGCLFITSAFESCSDGLLRHLDKGHTRAELDRVMALARAERLTIRPTWLPFTPWTTVEDVLATLRFIEQQQLIAHVSPVQYAIRLLLPPGSWLLPAVAADGLLGPLDERALSYEWRAEDPRTDSLQREIASIVATPAHTDAPTPSDPSALLATFTEVLAATLEATGAASAAPTERAPHLDAAPGLTEAWFC